MISYKIVIRLLLLTIMIISCNSYTKDELEFISKTEQYRIQKDSVMQFSEQSPFNFKGKVEFTKLKYFEPNPNFIFKSTLSEFEEQDTISIFGTKGEERSSVRYGFLELNIEGTKYPLNVYSSKLKSGKIYYSIWFTDKTTNNETYGVGRYLPFDLNSNKDHIYEIDFNLAFNPYCAYSSEYSCAIPSKEDYLDVAIKAGEKKYHD